MRYRSDVEYTQNYSFNRDYDRYKKGEEYLIEMYILSRCDCLLSGRTGILSVVLPMNQGRYEHTYIYDRGFYTPEDYLV